MSRHTNDDPRNRRETSQQTMGEVNHTNPMTGETFGDSQVFERGKVAVVDGGEAETAGEAEDADHDDEPMGDIDHAPRENAPSTNEVYTRGEDGTEADPDADAAAEDDPEEEPV